jgi:GNAT superfamily N-acetyltransferase
MKDGIMSTDRGDLLRIAFRSATEQDFDFCAQLYFAGMDEIIRQLGLDIAAQRDSLRQRWDPAQVEIITLDSRCWLVAVPAIGGRAVFGASFVGGHVQNRGIGTQVMRRLISTANTAGEAITLGVIKINPAQRLYERLGFKTTHEDDRKFYMRLEPNRGS